MASQERAASNDATDLQNKHESWWHSTVLAVAHMVSTTGLGAVPWRGAATVGNNGDDPGRSARLQLGSAEIAARIPSGYDRDDQVCAKQVNPFLLEGGADLGVGQCTRKTVGKP